MNFKDPPNSEILWVHLFIVNIFKIIIIYMIYKLNYFQPQEIQISFFKNAAKSDFNHIT